MIIPMYDLPSVLTRYSKNSLNDIETDPKNVTNAYGTTCSIRRSLLPKKYRSVSEKGFPQL